ncbi:hypothetical protein E2C01_043590 [Portunus trituberculatus]|uniref:Uncharacterized protein n=1 Tax=Portunus trituberculatus TaxID=210409 RepID=A0A5B7FW41_PORTR|nr:hypothetical protein [Portunus trituberculatus]
MTERLFAVMKDQLIFINELEKLKMSGSYLQLEPKQSEEPITGIQDQPLKDLPVVEQPINSSQASHEVCRPVDETGHPSLWDDLNNYRRPSRKGYNNIINALFEKFPHIGDPLENEAELVGNLKNGESLLKLTSSLPELIKFGKERCKRFIKYHKKYVKDLESATTQEQQTECSLLLALVLLPSLFGKDEELLLVESVDNIKDPTPVLVAHNRHHQVYINDNPLLRKEAT